MPTLRKKQVSATTRDTTLTQQETKSLPAETRVTRRTTINRTQIGPTTPTVSTEERNTPNPPAQRQATQLGTQRQIQTRHSARAQKEVVSTTPIEETANEPIAIQKGARRDIQTRHTAETQEEAPPAAPNVANKPLQTRRTARAQRNAVSAAPLATEEEVPHEPIAGQQEVRRQIKTHRTVETQAAAESTIAIEPLQTRHTVEAVSSTLTTASDQEMDQHAAGASNDVEPTTPATLTDKEPVQVSTTERDSARNERNQTHHVRVATEDGITQEMSAKRNVPNLKPVTNKVNLRQYTSKARELGDRAAWATTRQGAKPDLPATLPPAPVNHIAHGRDALSFLEESIQGRPQPRPRTTPITEESDDGFNVRRARQRQRAHSISVARSIGLQQLRARTIAQQQLRAPSIARSLSVATSDPSEVELRLPDCENEGDGDKDESVDRIATQSDDLESEMDLDLDMDPEMPVGINLDLDLSLNGVAQMDYGDEGLEEEIISCYSREPTAANRRTFPSDKEPGLRRPTQAGERFSADFDEEELDERQMDISSPSGSDYSEDRHMKEKVRAKKREQGEDPSDTEDDDEEDDRILANSAVPDTSPHHTRRGRVPTVGSSTSQAHQQGTRHSSSHYHDHKGKGHAIEDNEIVNDLQGVDVNGGSEDERGDKQEDGDGDVGEPRKMGRRFTKEEESAYDELGQRTVEAADKLGSRFGRKRPVVLFKCGLGMKSSKKGNISNVFKKWYAKKNNIDEGSTPAEWLKTMSAAYDKFMDGLAKDDIDGRLERMQPIIEEMNTMEVTETDHLKPATMRLKAYIKQFEGLATSIDRMDQDIQAVGILVYTGDNRTAQNMTGIFAGSNIARRLIDENNVRVQSMVNIITNKFRSVADDQRLKLSSSVDNQIVRWQREPNEKDREFFRRVVTGHFNPQLCKATGKFSTHLPWKGVESKGYKHRFRLTNWSPLVAAFPGPDFNIGARQVHELKQLALPILDNLPTAITIVPWTQAERQLTLGSEEFGEIPLVMDTEGTVLSCVKDCLDYKKDLAKLSQVKKRGADNEVTRCEVRPLPSRVHRRSPNPRPSKRAREETWQVDSDDGQDFVDNFGYPAMDMEPSAPTHQLYTIDSPPEGIMDAKIPFESNFHPIEYGDKYQKLPSSVRRDVSSTTASRLINSSRYVKRPTLDRRPTPAPSLHALAHQQRLPPSARTTKPMASHSHIPGSSQIPPSSDPIAYKESFRPPQSATRTMTIPSNSFYRTDAMPSSSVPPAPKHHGHFRKKDSSLFPGMAVAGPSRQH